MIFTGVEKLNIPKVNQLFFELRDVVLDSWATYSGQIEQSYPDEFTGIATQTTLFTFSSGKVLNDSNLFVGSYNTGESFSISGYLNTGEVGRFYLGDISFNSNNALANKRFGFFILSSPSSSTINCKTKIKTTPITYSLSLPDFNIGNSITGELTTNTSVVNFGSDFKAYNSYESLISGGSIISAQYANEPVSIVFRDNDLSYGTNLIQGIMTMNTVFGSLPINVSLNRGLPSSIVTDIQKMTTGDNTPFTGLFNGYWSGKQFVYEDTTSLLNFNYRVSKTDGLGNSLAKPIDIEFALEKWNTSATGAYITGFQLNGSGAYFTIPTVSFTGYYAVSGLQQSFESMLFSSGCSGNLPVSFTTTAGFGRNASGQLLTQRVSLSGIYTSGVNNYYTVYGYQMLSGGTGYTVAPIAAVNTGLYGSTCYDVPKTLGNQIWFRAFSGSGALSPQASYLTGEVLTTTGIVSGTTTGYRVTGIQITNLGSGYDNTYKPYLSFIRNSGDVMTGNASGTLLTQSFTSNSSSKWKLQSGLSANPLVDISYGHSIGTLGPNEENITISLSYSGLDVTQPLTGYVKITETATNTTVTNNFVYGKYYDTSPDFLKKKDNVNLLFNVGSELSFILSQDELDTLYSDAQFLTDGSFDLGDLDF